MICCQMFNCNCPRYIEDRPRHYVDYGMRENNSSQEMKVSHLQKEISFLNKKIECYEMQLKQLENWINARFNLLDKKIEVLKV